MGLLKKSRQSAIRALHKLIIDLWVAPLNSLALRLEEGRQFWIQKLLSRAAEWGANLGRIIVMNLRVHLKRWVGDTWSVVYIGDELSANVIRHYLFPSPPQEEELGRAFFWHLPGLIRKYSQQGNLIVCELNEMIHYKFMNTGIYFASPPWVEQVLEGLDRPIDEILADMNQAMRRHIRKLESQGFSYVLSKDPEDFDSFFHRMYLPYINRRYGELDAVIADYEHMFNRFQKGGLVLIKQNHTPVCGMICIWGEGWCSAQQMGVLDGEFDLVKQGANVALWWYTVDCARQVGAKHVDFGGSRPLTADGVFNFKRQYGTHVHKEIREHSRWHFYSQDLSPELRQYLDRQGFVQMLGNDGYKVVLPAPGSSLDKESFLLALREAENYGLAGVIVVTESRRIPIKA